MMLFIQMQAALSSGGLPLKGPVAMLLMDLVRLEQVLVALALLALMLPES